MRVLTALLFLLSLSFACSGEITQSVPAVIGNGGGLVDLTVALAPGDGEVYVNIHPRIGLMTQESIKEAVEYASATTENEETCNVLVTFRPSPSTTFIDGPSAGTALAVMTYALLENETVREDAIITGAVDEHGNVLPVGGLYEKAKGAAIKGAEYFITPKETVYEMLTLKRIENEYDIRILEAENVEEVIGFMVDDIEIEQEGLESREREIPELPEYDYSGLEEFRPVAEKMLSVQSDAIDGIDENDDDNLAIISHFRNEETRQQSILWDGYLFSAANEAFLNYIDIATIDAILSDDVDLPRKKGDVGKCLTGIRRPLLTDENFEWVVGADLRQAWAHDRLENAVVDELLLEEEFIEYNELMYGDAWCNVAKGILSAAPSGGERIDENSWKQIAESRISYAIEYGTTSDYTLSKLMMAKQSYEDGRYGAAIYDATYVIAMEEAAEELTSDIDAESEVQMMLNETPTSLWGKIYLSHAAFLYHMNETDVAYKTARYAMELDEATDAMRFEKEPISAIHRERSYNMTVVYGLASVILMFIFILVIVTIGKSYGGNERPRNIKANRTKKKKG